MNGTTSAAVGILGVMMTLAAIAAPVLSDSGTRLRRCTREDAQTLSPPPSQAGADPTIAAANAAISAEVARTLPAVQVRAQDNPAPRRFWTVRLVDSIDVGALRALSRLRILRLWDSARVTVFLGVDYAGHAGLHVQQQDPIYLPPLKLRNAPAALPPLRAIPLSSM